MFALVEVLWFQPRSQGNVFAASRSPILRFSEREGPGIEVALVPGNLFPVIFILTIYFLLEVVSYFHLCYYSRLARMKSLALSQSETVILGGSLGSF